MFFEVDKGWKPTRCLDLGTTVGRLQVVSQVNIDPCFLKFGDWVIDCAKHLPQCTFVRMVPYPPFLRV